MKKGMGKSGQQTMSMPFGMIFAIFLIIIFIVIAFVAISTFLDFGRTANVGIFYQDLQKAVDNAMHGQNVETDFDIQLPGGIVRVCFANLSAPINGAETDYNMIERFSVYEANTFLVPPKEAEGFEYKEIQNINISRITKNKNPYCVDVSRPLRIKKGFYDRQVTIE